MKSQILVLSFLLMVTSVACGQIDENTSGTNTKEQIQTPASVVHVLSINEFKEKMKTPEAQVIDVRTDEEVAEGMIPNATQMNVADWDSFVASTENLDPSKPVLVYCRSGARSNRAATYLAQNGFTEVYDLEGGILNWNKNKEETVKP